ncbi:Uncharacterised protein [BD1-7 clade bacterium]|uniref:Phage head morphogenesis domain-containing protein n=1 Tax=BD1-7 clade bacterium TaxID=2029982 RepID=A0A5S9Q288_9GAMM|nr:Uncharacterised protein [BD1-7 clade bacterium]
MTKVSTPGPVPQAALDYLRAKGYAVSFDHRDIWQAEHANAFTVAKAMQLDILETVREAVDQALESGQTFAEFQKQLQPTLEKKGWWGVGEETDPQTGESREVQLGSPRRLKTIYRTNLRTARAAGQWQRIQRNKQLRPYLRYRLGPSLEHREDHVKWNTLILPVDDPFWRTHFAPNGWGCKCRIDQISAAEAERLGGVSQRPKLETREYVNKRTGEVVNVPKGIDPGWDYNSGMERQKHLEKALSDKTMAAHPEDRKAAKSHGAYKRR